MKIFEHWIFPTIIFSSHLFQVRRSPKNIQLLKPVLCHQNWLKNWAAEGGKSTSPLMSAEENFARVSAERDKLLQENATLKRDKSDLETKITTISHSASEGETTILQKQNDLKVIELKTRQEQNDLKAAELKTRHEQNDALIEENRSLKMVITDLEGKLATMTKTLTGFADSLARIERQQNWNHYMALMSCVPICAMNTFRRYIFSNLVGQRAFRSCLKVLRSWPIMCKAFADASATEAVMRVPINAGNRERFEEVRAVWNHAVWGNCTYVLSNMRLTNQHAHPWTRTMFTNDSITPAELKTLAKELIPSPAWQTMQSRIQVKGEVPSEEKLIACVAALLDVAETFAEKLGRSIFMPPADDVL